MKRIVILLLLQGYLMAATLLHVDVNGVKVPVIFEQDKNLPLATVEFIFRDSGALASKKAGLASLSADLLNEGTKKEGSFKFAKDLEDRAIEFSTNVGRETFVFTIESLKEQFDFGLKKLMELLNDPNYTQEAFKSVQQKRLGILARKKDDFDYIAANGLRSLLFPNTPLALPQLGTIESIKSLELKDLEDFIKSHLFLNNLIVVVGGDFTQEEVQKLTKEFATNLKQGKVEPIPHFRVSEKNTTKEQYEPTKQAYIYFGAPYDINVSDKRQKVIGKVASFVLGSSGFGSRLMEEIRVKRGLAYSAYSRFVVNKTHQYFSGYLQTKLESQKEAMDVVQKVIDDFIQKGITKEELEAAKKFFLGSEPLRSETLSQRLNRAFHEYYSGLGLNFAQEELAIIERLKLDEVNEFIKNHPEIKQLSFFVVTAKK